MAEFAAKGRVASFLIAHIHMLIENYPITQRYDTPNAEQTAHKMQSRQNASIAEQTANKMQSKQHTPTGNG